MPERFVFDDDKIIHQRTHDTDSALKEAAIAREAPRTPMSDAKHVASVPMWLRQITAATFCFSGRTIPAV